MYAETPSSVTPQPKPEALPKSAHSWLTIKLGRVCELCMVTQPTGEFNDADECLRRRTR